MKNKSRLTQNPIRSIHTKKQLKNPCRLHNGNHEWDDCRQNPKNQKNDEKATMITTATGIMGTITEIEKKTDAPNQTALNL